jgi:neutral ceramidase
VTSINGYNNITSMSREVSTRQPFSTENDPLRPANSDRPAGLVVGAAAVDITPSGSAFLYGYPHEPRFSTGVHDPLLASALFLAAGDQSIVFVSVDTIWLSKQLVADVRTRIEVDSAIPADRIMVAATHTHSGPVTVPILSNADDPVVPPPDQQYLSILRDGIVMAVKKAVQLAEPAEIALIEARCPCIGGNRHDPNGTTIDEIPILAARSRSNPERWLGIMYINRVHPTVLHGDSLLISADFPGTCRRHLQLNLVGTACAVLSHLGAAGNQSPRYFARAHTFDEAERLGSLLAESIESAIKTADFQSEYSIECKSARVDLPPRVLPGVETAQSNVVEARRRMEKLVSNGAEYGTVRTAECAVFGAEETVSLAKAATVGTLQAAWASCLPAEIQLIRVGSWYFVGWPGEVFAEFALEIRRRHRTAHVITLANGELQGYLVTANAVRDRTYEAANAIFASPSSAELLVKATLKLFEQFAESDSVATTSAQSRA